MPGPQIPAGECQATLVFSFGAPAQQMVITYGVEVAAPTVAQANTLFGIWLTRWRPQTPVNFDFRHLELAYNPGGGGGALVTTSTTAAAAGTAGGASLPTNCALVVTKRTLTPGRRGRGRFYLPGPTEANVGVGGEVGAAPLANYQAAMTLVRTDHIAAGMPMTLLHVTAPFASTPITQLQVQRFIGTQRTRMRRA